MEPTLQPEEVRVLASLLEKEIATPEYYPLTLNALINACNQKTSRDPVVAYDSNVVLRALDSLREKKLIRVVSGAESRVAKYRQVFTETANLTLQQVSLLCVLMLRGPQTVGELRTRTDRLCSFENLTEVEKALQRLEDREAGALVRQLPRQPGTKEPRYAHLLAGEPLHWEAAAVVPGAQPSDSHRLERLEAEVDSLRDAISELRTEFAAFRKQFE
ncbi:MAG: YceH family protein [Acidobacteriota bacterium]